MINLDRYTSPRISPRQTRGKERVRLILSTALRLFDEYGIDHTTTNDIARAAHIPIGSVYRYFQNKDEIILAIAELQVDDVLIIFEQIAARDDLYTLSWQDILTLITDAWAAHARNNDSFAYLYFLRYSQSLRQAIEPRWEKVRMAYRAILQTRDSRITDAEAGLFIQLTWGAVETAMTDPEMGKQSVTILANHIQQTHPL